MKSLPPLQQVPDWERADDGFRVLKRRRRIQISGCNNNILNRKKVGEYFLFLHATRLEAFSFSFEMEAYVLQITIFSVSKYLLRFLYTILSVILNF